MLRGALAFTYQYSFGRNYGSSVSGIKTTNDIQNFIKNIPKWKHMTDIFKEVDCRCDDALEIVNFILMMTKYYFIWTHHILQLLNIKKHIQPKKEGKMMIKMKYLWATLQKCAMH